jgi:pimeloyl-ACP methyl ester carboxylesterase
MSVEATSAPAIVRETSVTIDGIRAPVSEVGSAACCEAIVFVHGNPGSTRDWDNLMRRVGEFGRGLAMDMPGFGAADKPPRFDFSVPGYARHLGRLFAERGVARAHPVMHDFGGPWGLAWAAANPQAVASVTCINTGVLSGHRWHYLARIWQTPVVGELFMATTTKAGMRLLLYAEQQRQVFPRAEVRILPDSGHWPFADDPDAVGQWVVPFLRRQVQRH